MIQYLTDVIIIHSQSQYSFKGFIWFRINKEFEYFKVNILTRLQASSNKTSKLVNINILSNKFINFILLGQVFSDADKVIYTEE